MREIILDTETTGLDYKSGDRVIEVGCVELLNHVPTGENLQFYCYTDKKINEGANTVHGITNEFLKNHPPFDVNAQKFLDFIKNDTLVIHNADFDIGFINNELKLIGLNNLKNNIVDTVPLARKTLDTRIANLDYLCRRFSVDLSKRSYHGALLDCHLLAEVYIELRGGKQTALNLKNLEKKSTQNPKKNKNYSQDIKKVEISPEEIKNHKKLIEEIKSPLWQKMDY